MVNLVVAIIVSDIEELKREGLIQDSINKAYHIISHGNLLSCRRSLLGQKVQDSNNEVSKNNKTEICVHSICFNCKGLKVSASIKTNLLQIVEKRRNEQSMYKYGASTV